MVVPALGSWAGRAYRRAVAAGGWRRDGHAGTGGSRRGEGEQTWWSRAPQDRAGGGIAVIRERTGMGAFAACACAVWPQMRMRAGSFRCRCRVCWGGRQALGIAGS